MLELRIFKLHILKLHRKTILQQSLFFVESSSASAFFIALIVYASLFINFISKRMFKVNNRYNTNNEREFTEVKNRQVLLYSRGGL